MSDYTRRLERIERTANHLPCPVDPEQRRADRQRLVDENLARYMAAGLSREAAIERLVGLIPELAGFFDETAGEDTPA